jgi:hypothetical protein
MKSFNNQKGGQVMGRSRAPVETEPVPGENPSESRHRPGEPANIPDVESHADSPGSIRQSGNPLGETDSDDSNESDIKPFLG